jgi:hypothetical protein
MVAASADDRLKEALLMIRINYWQKFGRKSRNFTVTE